MVEKDFNSLKRSGNNQGRHKKQKKGSRQRSIRQTHQLGEDGTRASNKQATSGPCLPYRGQKHDIRRRSYRSHSATHRKDLQRAKSTNKHTTLEPGTRRRGTRPPGGSWPSGPLGQKRQSIGYIRAIKRLHQKHRRRHDRSHRRHHQKQRRKQKRFSD
jgi:hypothetical protein